jgi:hypothetical protein
MRELDDPISHIEAFNNSNPIPRANGSRQVLFRGLSGEKVDRQLSENDKTMLREYGEYRLSQFKDFLVDIDFEEHIRSYVRREGELKSDPDIVFQKGQTIDYYKDEYKYWIVAEVIEDYGPILQVNYKIPEIVVSQDRLPDKKSNVKINKDSVKSYGVYTNDICTQINGLYQYLYEKAVDKGRTGRRY